MPQSDEVVVKSAKPDSVVSWASREVRRFFQDPLGYAIDKWIYLIFLGFGIYILAGASKWLYQLVRGLF